MFKKFIAFYVLTISLISCAPQPTNTIDSNKLSKYEIEEQLRSKIQTDKRLKTLGNRFNNEFLISVKIKELYWAFFNISK